MTRAILATLEKPDTSPETIRASVAAALARQEAGARSRPLPEIADDMMTARQHMIAIQAEAYPSDWPEADRREMAEIHLFGRKSQC